MSIIYVSHKMDEVFRLCRRATILRDGQLVDVLDLTEVGEAAVVAGWSAASPPCARIERKTSCSRAT